MHLLMWHEAVQMLIQADLKLNKSLVVLSFLRELIYKELFIT